MNRQERKLQLLIKIKQAAQKYKNDFVGKIFLYVFNNKSIEVIFRKSEFKHLTGVETSLSPNDYYKEAVNGTLGDRQIYFSPRHPFVLAKEKVDKLLSLQTITTTRVKILENIITDTFTYDFGATDFVFTVCFSHDDNQANTQYNTRYIARSLRTDDSVSKSSESYDVDFIFMKKNNEALYSTVTYNNPDKSISELPEDILKKISSSLL